MIPRTIAPPPLDTRTGPAVTKAADVAPTRRAAALPASMLCHQLHMLALWNAHRRNLMLMNFPMSQVRVHMPTTGAHLGVCVNLRTMGPSPHPPTPPLPINLGLSCVTYQAPLIAGSPWCPWTPGSTTASVTVALLVLAGVEPLLRLVLLGHSMSPAAYGSPLD